MTFSSPRVCARIGVSSAIVLSIHPTRTPRGRAIGQRRAALSPAEGYSVTQMVMRAAGGEA